jgi:hydrogenase nickel incorporation protein HypA/HybF
MHEWALAESVVATIERELKKHKGATLHAVNLLFGELQNIDPEIFQTGMEEMLAEIPREGEVLHIDTERARFLCNACGAEWGLDETSTLPEEQREAIHFLPEAAHAFLSCPACRSRDYQITAGRGVRVASIELLEPGARG